MTTSRLTGHNMLKTITSFFFEEYKKKFIAFVIASDFSNATNRKKKKYAAIPSLKKNIALSTSQFYPWNVSKIHSKNYFTLKKILDPIRQRVSGIEEKLKKIHSKIIEIRETKLNKTTKRSH